MFLAIDSSLGTSVALVSERGEILAECSSADPRGHAETIGALIRDVFDSAGSSPAEVSAVVMGVGPGPFTGLRGGMAAAEAFAHSRSLPVVALVSHDAPAHDAGDVVIVTDARRGEVAFSVYQGEGASRRIKGPELARPEDLDGALGQYRTLPRLEVEAISAGKLGLVAARYREAGVETESRAPRYLRAPDVTVAR